MVADKGKKVKVSAGDENSEQLDGEIIHSIEKLQEVQDELEKINEEASEKVLEVEQKYNEVRRPIYEKRSEIIKSIPDFWLSAFLSHPALATLLTEEDLKIFKFFSSLEVEECKDVKSGYSITFNFRPNPYFEDTKLTKTYTYLDEGITNVTATEIKWKEGMGIQNGVTRKKGKKRSLEEESFFLWFSSSKLDDATAEIQDEVAEIIKEDFWPRPLTFFNNDPDDEEDVDEDDDDDEESHANGSDEDEDEEEDDDDDEEEDDDEDEGEGGN